MLRLGAPSYLIPADLLANVDFIIGLDAGISDIQLLLFESDEYGTNFPAPAVIRELTQRAADHNLSYSVHLPLDLALSNAKDRQRSEAIMRRAIESTRALDPIGYTLHLDGSLLAPPWGACSHMPMSLLEWRSAAADLLGRATEWCGAAERLCVENLEGWDPAAFEPLLVQTGVSRTADIGHLWVTGCDPVVTLKSWQSATRLVHLHGVGERDHQSLLRMDRNVVKAVTQYLAGEFDGVVTLEIFEITAFRESLDLVRAIEGTLP